MLSNYENTRLLFSKKLNGGALYIAILVSIIIGITLSFFILIARYNQRGITVFSQSSQLYYNLKSGFAMAQSGYFGPEKSGAWIKNTLNDDSVRVKKMNWGAYLILSVETKNRHTYLSESGLYGTPMNPDVGLMISENSRPIGMSGSITFGANCYLPAAGIKPAYIEGQSYMGSPENTKFIKRSPGQIPEINQEIMNGLNYQQRHSNLHEDSAVAMVPENFTQAFTQKTMVWEISLKQLSRLNLANNIKIVAESLEVDSTTHLDNVLIVCGNIRFKKGFKGKVHIIASDSISMEEGCVFQFPSSFVLFPKDENLNGLRYIQFNRDCKFFGGVLALNSVESTDSKKVLVKLNATSEINGFVYSAGYLHAEGTINATVIADKLLLKTPSAVYENHLMSCVIDPKKYSNLLAVPLVFKERTKLVCCEKIN